MPGLNHLVILIATGVFGVCSAQNMPVGLECDPYSLVDWVNSEVTTGDYWMEVAASRDFSAVCEQVDLWITNLAGCIDGVATFIEMISGVEAKNELMGFYNGIAMVQFYCNIAPFETICDINAISGCATSTILTWQAQIEGNVEEVGEICGLYNQLIETMGLCVNNSIAACTPDEQESVMASYDLVFNYFEIASDYCGEGCGNFILLVSSQFDSCDYVNVDWSSLRYEEYCTYMQNMLDCIWTVYSTCPFTSPLQTQQGVSGVLVYANAMGCKINVDGIQLADVPDEIKDVVLPSCVGATINCARTAATSIVGITNTAGIYGGYDVSGVMDRMNVYAELLTSGSFGDVCQVLNTVGWQTVQTCANLIIDNCPVPQPGSAEALVIINDDIGTIIGEVCSAECTQLQEAVTEYMSCTAYLREEEIDILRYSVNAIAALFSPGGGNTEVCEMLQGYLGCIIEPIKKCGVIYDNYLLLVDSFSSLEMVVSVCNIQIDLSDGEITIGDPMNNYPLIYWSGCESRVVSLTTMCLTIIGAYIFSHQSL